MNAVVPTYFYVALSAVLFTLGALGVLTKKNPVVIFMSIELMLNSANLALVAFARQLGNMDGHLFVFFVMTVAAAEVTVGLGIIVAIFRTKKSVDVDEVDLLKW